MLCEQSPLTGLLVSGSGCTSPEEYSSQVTAKDVCFAASWAFSSQTLAGFIHVILSI